MAAAPLITISAGEMLAFFFLLLGPIKILGPFVKLTRGAEPRFCRQLAVRSILLAFPTIVTPAGIAAVIIFVTLSPDLAGKATIGLLLLVILVLDLIAMWYARAILKWLALPLYILGAVLGVIQVALGLNIMLVNLSRIGVFPMIP